MEISRQTLFGKLSPTLFQSLESATLFCKLRGNTHVELVHWLHQLLQGTDNDCLRLVRHCGLDKAALDRDITETLAALPAGATAVQDFSSHIMDTVERAWTYATLALNENRIRSGCLISTLVGTPELRRVLLGISREWRKLQPDHMTEVLTCALSGSPEEREGPYDSGSRFLLSSPDHGNMGHAPDASLATAGMAGMTGTAGAALDRFCTDLTHKAQEGLVDPVLGREQEIRAMIDILLRRRQNNPLLTGDAGVGKTAIVEGLALAIAANTVPPALAGVRLLSLDVGGLLAGASMKGEFESRLRALIEEASHSAQPVILFVDEIHTLVGAGGAQGTGDAANLLKPALARGALRTIGATTWSEYKKHIEKDPALTRRFQPLHIGEPDEASAVEMLRGLTHIFRQHHGVIILDEALRAAVRLSARYLPARQLPDKAISLLDTACARVALSRSAPPPPVAHARRQLAALEMERNLLTEELRLCIGRPEDRTQRLQEVHTALTQQQSDLQALEAIWQAQLEWAEQVDAARAQAALTPSHEAQQNLLALEKPPCMPGTEVSTLVFSEVNASVVAGIVADWTGIPLGRMLRDDLRAVMELDTLLRRRVLGQDHALTLLARRIQTARALLTDPGKPVGVFFLVGPSGVGKTETALALAEALYGGEQNCISVNMSEFQESHTVSTLKGAPPGYVGYGEGGVLTEAVRRRPHSVILLDEIEKAHPDVYEIFYQVFDKGWMEDGEGRHIDFKNTVILLTSNVGAEAVSALCADEDLLPHPEALVEAVGQELAKVFPAAFLGRLTVLPYYSLRHSALHSIVTLHLHRVAQRLQAHHNLSFSYDDALIPHILDRCAVAETGARRIISFIEEHILPELSTLWLEHLHAKPTTEACGPAPRPSGLHINLDNQRPTCHLEFR